MKKNKFLVPLNRNLKKLLLTMKLCLLFLLISAASLMANSGYSQNTTLSIHLKNATLRDLISEVEKQSEFIFVFYDKVVDLDKKIDVNVEGQTIDKILDQIFKSSELTYRIFDRQIGIGKRNPVTGAIELPISLDKLMAADKKLTGVVKDIKGEPIPGATVIVKGTTIGTITDNEGQFRLSLPNDSKTLIFSFIGMKTQNVLIGNKENFIIIMDEETVALEEFVVVAYGTQKKVSVTGAVSSVSNKDLKLSPVANFSTALSGRLPGLSIVQGTGMPGREQVAIYLRGQGTTGDTSPLILIDGVPRDDIGSLDANEVENVSILKDAASTAVFGVRGANGVILVTTRRGEVGKTELNMTAEYSMQSLIYRNIRIHSWEYADLMNLRNRNDGVSDYYTPWQIERFKKGDDPVFFPDRDAFSEYLKPYAPQTKLNMNIRGGTKEVQYFINTSYLHQGSMFRNESPSKLGYDPSFRLDRFNFRANVDYKVASNLKATVNLSGNISTVNLIPWTDGLEWTEPDFNHPYIAMSLAGVNHTPPTDPGPITPVGTFDNTGKTVPAGEWVRTNNQAYARMNRDGYIQQTLTTLNSSLAFDYDMSFLTKGLKSKLELSYDVNGMGWVKATSGYAAYNFVQAKNANERSYFTQVEWNGTLHPETALSFYNGRGQSADYKFNGQFSIDYARTFNEKHAVTAMIIGQRDNWVVNSSSSLYLPFNMLYLSSRASYTYNRRYIAEVNMGYNGSEQFAPGKRFGLFPAFSGGWVLSEENLFKSWVKPKIIDYFKFRASWGVVGNDKIGNTRFLYLDDMKISEGGTIPTLGRGTFVSQGMVGNPDLTWERSKKQNFGIDINFLKNFALNFDYFKEYRDNILISRGTIPMVQGIQSDYLPKANMGVVENGGYEFQLVYKKNFNKDFSLQVHGNYNFAKNKVLNADEVARPTGRGNYLYAYRETGFPIGQVWGLKIDYNDGAKNGFINNAADLAKYSVMYKSGAFVPDAFLGDWKFKDMNGDHVINDKDVVPLGYSSIVPEINYSFTFALSYKLFDFNFLLQGVEHKSNYLTLPAESDGYFAGEWQLHSWTADRFKNNEPIMYRALTTRSLSYEERSEFVLSDLGYLRLKNIEFGYSLSNNIVKQLGLRNIRVSVSGQNVLTWSKMKAKILDPETSNENNYPITRNINFAINMTF